MLYLNNNIGSITLGNTPIDKIYKGNNLIFNSYDPHIILKGEPNSSGIVRINSSYDGTNPEQFSYTLDSSGNGIVKISYANSNIITSLYQGFYLNSNIYSIDFNNCIIDFNNFIDYDSNSGNFLLQCFYGLENLTEIKNFNPKHTTKLTNIAQLFYNCQSLPGSIIQDIIDKISYNRCNSLYSTFYNCKNLKSLDLSNFSGASGSNIYIFASAFAGCSSLESIIMPDKCCNYDRMNNINGFSVFEDCSKLKVLDLSSWVYMPYNIDSMFNNCTSLEYIDFGNCNFRYVTTMKNTFSGCSNLKTIRCNEETQNKLLLSKNLTSSKLPEVTWEIIN